MMTALLNVDPLKVRLQYWQQFGSMLPLNVGGYSNLDTPSPPSWTLALATPPHGTCAAKDLYPAWSFFASFLLCPRYFLFLHLLQTMIFQTLQFTESPSTADSVLLLLKIAPAPLAQCANCGTNATMRCAGCIDAPEYQPSDSVGSVYCSRDCQKGHWSNHKAHCHALGQRKKLLRTANILKAAPLTYREVVYNIDLTKIEFQDRVLCLHQNQRPITA